MAKDGRKSTSIRAGVGIATGTASTQTLLTGFKKLLVEHRSATDDTPPPRRTKTPKRKWQQDRIAKVALETIRANDVTESTPELVRQVVSELERRKIPVPSDDTIKRALGRR